MMELHAFGVWRHLPGVFASSLLLAVLPCAGGLARAQWQEPRMQQILQPDTGKAFEFRDKKATILNSSRNRFDTAKVFSDQRPARTKTFRANRRAAVDKSYADARPARDADAVYTTERGRVIQNVGRRIEGERIDSGRADLAARGRGTFLRSYPFIRKAEVRGTRQRALDQQFADRPSLTVDQVRELLNKNK